MGTTMVGAGPVGGAGAMRMVFVPEIVLDAWQDLARERGLSEHELWGSFWTLALEGGGHRARLVLSQFEEDVHEHVFQVPDAEPWVSAVCRSGFIPLRRSEGRVCMVAPEPRVPLADAVNALTGSPYGDTP